MAIVTRAAHHADKMGFTQFEKSLDIVIPDAEGHEPQDDGGVFN